ncbi:hypothetical protein K439DRAFT_247297 [Ramaria rubella]|nr:hypothetical protein K439DRAFT_247297 [Ramaria rubella]
MRLIRAYCCSALLGICNIVDVSAANPSCISRVIRLIYSRLTIQLIIRSICIMFTHAGFQSPLLLVPPS